MNYVSFKSQRKSHHVETDLIVMTSFLSELFCNVSTAIKLNILMQVYSKHIDKFFWNYKTVGSKHKKLGLNAKQERIIHTHTKEKKGNAG